MDNYVPKSFNTQYDRKEQGIVADYVVIMGYDEYYAGSPEAGPVSSYNYVKEGITETLKRGSGGEGYQRYSVLYTSVERDSEDGRRTEE